jgi:hypothetical protein
MAKPDAVRITTARSSAADDMRSRQRRYAVSMTIRIVCFVAAVAVGPGVLRWVLVAGAVFLPLFAVIMANAGDQRDDGFSLPGAPGAHELTAPDDEGRGK